MIFEQHGCDAWYDMEIKDLLYPGSGLNPDDLEKTLDILDVWFDSGSTQNAVLRSGNYDAGTFLLICILKEVINIEVGFNHHFLQHLQVVKLHS
ncbi:hypothetical protein MASR2M54_14150 [Aliarcobacter cryaerophilus]